MICESSYHLFSLFQDSIASLYEKLTKVNFFLLKRPHNHRQMQTNPITKVRLKELQSGETSFILNIAQRMAIAANLSKLEKLR